MAQRFLSRMILLLLVCSIARADDACFPLLQSNDLYIKIANSVCDNITVSTRLRDKVLSVLTDDSMSPSIKRTILNSLLSANTVVKDFPGWMKVFDVIHSLTGGGGNLSPSFNPIKGVIHFDSSKASVPRNFYITDSECPFITVPKRVSGSYRPFEFSITFHEMSHAEFDIYFRNILSSLSKIFPDHVVSIDGNRFNVDMGLYSYLTERYAYESELRLDFESKKTLPSKTVQTENLQPNSYREKVSDFILKHRYTDIMRAEDIERFRALGKYSIEAIIRNGFELEKYTEQDLIQDISKDNQSIHDHLQKVLEANLNKSK